MRLYEGDPLDIFVKVGTLLFCSYHTIILQEMCLVVKLAEHSIRIYKK